MKFKNYLFSIICFVISIVSTGLLFVGLFSAKWDYIITHTFDTIFVLLFGTLIPVGLIAGVILLIRGLFLRENYLLMVLVLIIAISSISSFLTIGSEIFMKSVIELYKIKLGLL